MAARAPRPPDRPWVILLVDDEPDILLSLARLIETGMPNVRVVKASSGREGLDVLDRERIDLIASDFRMPGMDGIEFLFQARKHHPHIPRAMVTAFGTDDLARRAVTEVFVDEFVSKSFSPEKTLEQLSRLLRYEPPTSPLPTH